MLTVCPWNYPPGENCAGCKYIARCILPHGQERIVVNGLFGVWRVGTRLLVENTNGSLTLSAAHLDSLIAILQAAQQELAQPWTPVHEP